MLTGFGWFVWRMVTDAGACDLKDPVAQADGDGDDVRVGDDGGDGTAQKRLDEDLAPARRDREARVLVQPFAVEVVMGAKKCGVVRVACPFAGVTWAQAARSHRRCRGGCRSRRAAAAGEPRWTGRRAAAGVAASAAAGAAAAVLATAAGGLGDGGGGGSGDGGGGWRAWRRRRRRASPGGNARIIAVEHIALHARCIVAVFGTRIDHLVSEGNLVGSGSGKEFRLRARARLHTQLDPQGRESQVLSTMSCAPGSTAASG